MTSLDDAVKLNTREIHIREHEYGSEAKRTLDHGWDYSASVARKVRVDADGKVVVTV